MHKADKILIIGLNTLVFILALAYLFAPESTCNDKQLIQPFFFYQRETVITKQVWADYAFWRIGMVIMVYIPGRFLPAIREEMFYFFCFWMVYLFEYFLVFNQPFITICHIPISFSLFIGLAMIFIFGRTLFKK